MITAPGRGFVFLAMPKCGSVSAEAALRPYGDASLVGQIAKHCKAARFERVVRPQLRSAGFADDAYAVVSLFREPIEWLASWWRYRQRPFMLKKHPERYTGNMSFEEFAEHFLARNFQVIQFRGHPARFISEGQPMRVCVDRVFALDRPDVWVSWFSNQVGADLEIETRNVSRIQTTPAISSGMRRQLEEFLAPDYEVLEHLRPTGSWESRGYQLER